jgi:hypothetical protein
LKHLTRKREVIFDFGFSILDCTLNRHLTLSPLLPFSPSPLLAVALSCLLQKGALLIFAGCATKATSLKEVTSRQE